MKWLVGNPACGGGSEDPNTDVVMVGDVAVLIETESYSGDVGGSLSSEGPVAPASSWWR